MFTQETSLFKTSSFNIPDDGGKVKLLMIVMSILRCLMHFLSSF